MGKKLNQRTPQMIIMIIMSLVGLCGVIYTILSSPDDRYWMIFAFFCFILIVPIIAAFREFYFFEDIKCKVTEKDGKIRYTHVYRNLNKTVYKIHGRSGEWVLLNNDQIKIVEKKRPKKVTHGAHVTAEFSM